MTGLINLISQYSGKLNILPIIVAMTVIISILLQFLSKRKISKYIPSLIILVGAIILMLSSLRIFTSKRGLDLTWIATFLGTAGLVGIFTCFIIDLIVSIMKDSRQGEGTEIRASKKTRKKPARSKQVQKASKPVTRARAASKSKAPTKTTDSKFHTKKIETVNSNNIKATKARTAKKNSVSYEADSKEK